MPGSRRGPADRGANEGQYRICCEKARDKHDRIIVQEKLDGSNVSIANIDGDMIALSRAGWLASTSPYELHHVFARWVEVNKARFDIIPRGFRLCGEWLAMAHGTIYKLPHEPFVAFDLMTGMKRVGVNELLTTLDGRFTCATTIHDGPPLPIADGMSLLGDNGFHGCIDGQPEGLVYRVERKGVVDFLAKYVRPDKVDGKYLPQISGTETWLWKESPAAH